MTYSAHLYIMCIVEINVIVFIPKKDTSQDWNLLKQRFRLMEFQPHIYTPSN